MRLAGPARYVERHRPMSRALLMKKPDIEEFFRRLSEAMPEPKTELEYTNTYTLLVAVALSAQATDIGVNKATKELFKKVDTPEKMLKLGEARSEERRVGEE